jgi:hypothetical protein
MAVRDDFAPGEVLAAADLNDTFASKLPYSYGTATPSTSDSGFLWYDSNSTPAATKFWDGSAFVPFGGKILQVVRATDSTARSTTSATAVDVTGMSVTITPQKSDSAIIIIATFFNDTSGSGSDNRGAFQITDSSNNVILGTPTLGDYSSDAFVQNVATMIGYATPATTSAVTYKLRFYQVSTTSVRVLNADMTGQMYAIEVSA